MIRLSISRLSRNRNRRMCVAALAFLAWFAAGGQQANAQADASDAPSTFDFNLSADSYTSAGVYNSRDELIRTLWRRVRYLAGNNSGTWDGKDDNHVAVAAGNYQIKLLCHNVSYSWDGVIGNTSASFTGGVHSSGTSDNIQDLAFDGSAYVYEALGYNEGRCDIRRFKISSLDPAGPQKPQDIVPATIFTNFGLVATDGSRLYCANVGGMAGVPASQDSAGYRTFVAAYTIDEEYYQANHTFQPHRFSDSSAQAVQFGSSPGFPSYPSCLDVGQGTASPQVWKSITGLAVQKTGNLLAVAHGDMMQPLAAPKHFVAGQNKVSLFDKLTGAPLGFITVANLQRIAFAPNGDLWIVTGATQAGQPPTLCKVPVGGLPGAPQLQVIQQPSQPLVNPLAITVTPDASALVLVADGGASQQVKAYNSSDGTLVWTHGQSGGYGSNGSLVTNDKFQFGEGVGLTALSDGSFWVGDGGCAHGGTNRTLHLSSTRAYLEQIACLTSNLTTGIVSGDPNRVFWNFLEFQVDYTQPLNPGDPGANGSWKLVRNWLAGQSLTKFFGGPHTIVTLSNGKVYGLIHLNDGTDRNALYELTAAGTLRDTGLVYYDNYSNNPIPAQALAYSLFAQGDPQKNTLLRHSDANQVLYGQSLTGFDALDNPTWGEPQILASPGSLPDDPQTGRGHPYVSGWQLPVTASGDVVIFDQSESTGWHLGGIAPDGKHFRWRVSPSVLHDEPMDGLGSFDIGDGTVYKGNKVVTLGHNVVFGYNGEFWNQSEASQHMHFYDDGLFIGQFGTTGNIHSPFDPAPPGFAGNDFCPNIVQCGKDDYLYVNDESNHGGIHRWHLLGAEAAHELSGTVAFPGGSVTLAAGALPAPSAVRAVASNGSATVNWLPNAASSYRVKWSDRKGGPYTNVSANLTSASYRVTGLTNEAQYYFIVTSFDAQGNESFPAEEVHVKPIDVSMPVHLLGRLDVFDQTEQFLPATPHNVFVLPFTPLDFSNPDDPNKRRFAVQLHPMFDTLGTLHAIDFGSRGYNLFNYNGAQTSLARLPAGYAVSQPVNCRFVSTAPDQEGLSCALRTNGQAALLRTCLRAKAGAGGAYSFRITVPDNVGWHCLTVVSPDFGTNLRHYKMRLASTGNPAQYREFDPDPSNTATQGYDHLVQFAFRGSVDLTMTEAPESTLESVVGNRHFYACTYLSAIFLDDYPAQ